MDKGMHELVNDHIVHHCQGCLNELPGEAERAFGTARSPARAGRCDSNSLVRKLILACKELYTPRQDLPGLFPVPAFKDPGCIALMGGSQLKRSIEP